MPSPVSTPAGNQAKVETWYRTFAPAVYRRCLAMLANPDDANDATQEVFVILLKKMDSFRGDSEVMTWIYRIATNHCLNRLRARKTESRGIDNVKVSAKEFSDGTNPESGSEFDRRQLLTELLQNSKTRQVQIVLHRYYDEMTQLEISQVLGITERAVRKSLKRFHDTARERLTEFERVMEDVG